MIGPVYKLFYPIEVHDSNGETVVEEYMKLLTPAVFLSLRDAIHFSQDLPKMGYTGYVTVFVVEIPVISPVSANLSRIEYGHIGKGKTVATIHDGAVFIRPSDDDWEAFL